MTAIIVSFTSCYSLPSNVKYRRIKVGHEVIKECQPIALATIQADIPYDQNVYIHTKNSSKEILGWISEYSIDFGMSRDYCENLMEYSGMDLYRENEQVFDFKSPSKARLQLAALVVDCSLYHVENGLLSNVYAKVETECILYDSFSDSVVYRKRYVGKAIKKYLFLAQQKQVDDITQRAFTNSIENLFIDKVFREYLSDPQCLN